MKLFLQTIPEYKEYWNVVRKKRLQRNKRKAIDYKGGKCQNCGINGEDCIYDFHHLDPLEKDKKISQFMNAPWETIQKELDKCVLLCANCHRVEHFDKIEYNLPTKLENFLSREKYLEYKNAYNRDIDPSLFIGDKPGKRKSR